MYIQARIRKYVIGGADLPPPTLNRVKVADIPIQVRESSIKVVAWQENYFGKIAVALHPHCPMLFSQGNKQTNRSKTFQTRMF